MRKIFLTTFSLLLIISIVSLASASEVIIKIRAVNPLKKAAETTIKEYLPKGITSADIINKGNFKLGMDKTKDLYYVEQKIMMKPKEVLLFQVEVKDVWVVAQDRLDSLRKEAQKVYLTKLPESKNPKTADKLYVEINKALDKVAARQTQNTIAKVGVEAHMDEYWKDADSLKQVESDIKMLRTLLEKKPEKKTEKK